MRYEIYTGNNEIFQLLSGAASSSGVVEHSGEVATVFISTTKLMFIPTHSMSAGYPVAHDGVDDDDPANCKQALD